MKGWHWGLALCLLTGVVCGMVWEEHGVEEEERGVVITLGGRQVAIDWVWNEALQAHLPVATPLPGQGTVRKERERHAEAFGLVRPPAGRLCFSTTIETSMRERLGEGSHGGRATVLLYEAALAPHEVAGWYASRLAPEWGVERLGGQIVWVERGNASAWLTGIRHAGVSYVAMMIQW